MNVARLIAARSFAFALAVALGTASCSSDAAPSPGETTMAGFTLTSSSFAEGGAIPTKQSCDGADLSPALAWSGAPAGTAAFALIVDDPDANGFVHWVAYDIPAGTTSLPEGVTATGEPPQGRNDFGNAGWGGPCPPTGTHHYRFTLYALSRPLALSGTPSAANVRSAAAAATLARTTLTGVYTRRR